MTPAFATLPFLHKNKEADKPKAPAPLDVYVREATHRIDPGRPGASAGSLWVPGSRLADAVRDLRASQVDDLVTILVSESASAVVNGQTKTSRASSANNSVLALAGKTTPTGRLANLANLSGTTTLNGQGSTTRQTSLTTELSARVVGVLPNGYLVVEGSKLLQVNSEHQTVTVRGVVRPEDLAADNTVQSQRLADLEVDINGKGVVNDSIRRPWFLYRVLLGLLPF